MKNNQASDFSELSELIYQFLRSRSPKGKVDYLNFFAFVSFLFAILLLLFALKFGVDTDLGSFYYFSFVISLAFSAVLVFCLSVLTFKRFLRFLEDIPSQVLDGTIGDALAVEKFISFVSIFSKSSIELHIDIVESSIKRINSFMSLFRRGSFLFTAFIFFDRFSSYFGVRIFIDFSRIGDLYNNIVVVCFLAFILFFSFLFWSRQELEHLAIFLRHAAKRAEANSADVCEGLHSAQNLPSESASSRNSAADAVQATKT
ncbi:hypothetical protein [Pannonibacter phragmitetus]|uniref:hypothetical protein n=1 Tax=Pannonibacter phragmitetus TaxID=121719 RepID=UPI0011C068C4|nr:hypothetical protein [Pannonibacter phragmitetus]